MLTVCSSGCSTPVRAAAVSALMFISATSPSYSRRMPLRLVSVSWPAKEPSSSASLTKGVRRGASSAVIDGMLSALETAPFIR